MQNAADDTCVVAYKPFNKSVCEKVSFNNLATLKLKTNPDGSEPMKDVEQGTVTKFNLNTFRVADDEATVS